MQPNDSRTPRFVFTTTATTATTATLTFHVCRPKQIARHVIAKRQRLPCDGRGLLPVFVIPAHHHRRVTKSANARIFSIRGTFGIGGRCCTFGTFSSFGLQQPFDSFFDIVQRRCRWWCRCPAKSSVPSRPLKPCRCQIRQWKRVHGAATALLLSVPGQRPPCIQSMEPHIEPVKVGVDIVKAMMVPWTMNDSQIQRSIEQTIHVQSTVHIDFVCKTNISFMIGGTRGYCCTTGCNQRQHCIAINWQVFGVCCVRCCTVQPPMSSLSTKWKKKIKRGQCKKCSTNVHTTYHSTTVPQYHTHKSKNKAIP